MDLDGEPDAEAIRDLEAACGIGDIFALSCSLALSARRLKGKSLERQTPFEASVEAVVRY